jgi:sugar (pentulose or hexulose) kinase
LKPNPTPAADTGIFLGLDFGTSGARLIAIDAVRQPVFQTQHRFLENSWPEWRSILFRLLDDVPLHLRQATRGIACCGTSSTCLICDDRGNPLAPAVLYNESRPAALPPDVPRHHLAASPSSSLIKWLWFAEHHPTATFFLHQADWLAFQLHGVPGLSDYHNALKLGYDVERLEYPAWLMALPAVHLLPHVLSPGAVMGTILPSWVRSLGFNPDCRIHAGTTDSIAAFFASGARRPGQAVTSLGSTLVLKLLSERRVESVKHGVYSHRCGDLWLAGGASNCGASILERTFGRERLSALSHAIDPANSSPLDYYPLPVAGERFPVCDPDLQPRLDPRPADDVEYLHGLLESLARIEAQGYALLEALGATPVTEILTAGGGASNRGWQAIRERVIGRPIHTAINTEAAFGAALLAAEGTRLLYSSAY